MKQILLITLGIMISIYSNGQDEIIKDAYQDKMNGQTTVIIKDSTSTDAAVLNQLDLDNYTVGQEVRITEDMIAELNRLERIKALGYDPRETKSDLADKDNELEVVEIGVITPSTRLEVGSDESESMIQMGDENMKRGEGEEIFIRKNPIPAKFLELLESEEYQNKLKELIKTKGELIFA